MKHLALVVLYEPQTETERPVPIARIASPEAVRLAALAAVAEADLMAGRLAACDEDTGLADGARQDAARLREVLGAFGIDIVADHASA